MKHMSIPKTAVFSARIFQIAESGIQQIYKVERMHEHVLEVPYQVTSGCIYKGGGDRGGGGRKGGARRAGGRGDRVRGGGGGGLRLVDEPDEHAAIPAPAQQHPSTLNVLSTSDHPSTSYRPSTPLYTPAQLFSDHIDWDSYDTSMSAHPPVRDPQGEPSVRDLKGGKELDYDFSFMDLEIFQSLEHSAPAPAPTPSPAPAPAI
ncbi:hypothetical protein K7X08_030852 [Anisodus acutangulus]|uniref:Uncharacterized protein n=1 Tax=Anisodus acutangulus TaxID=402998 RepID=A0A9Q1M0Y5_9SOLA|nr:hypothetical protein K7X08_030852 [Anisodus acutangulus]